VMRGPAWDADHETFLPAKRATDTRSVARTRLTVLTNQG
jgi:hypothetical protein